MLEHLQLSPTIYSHCSPLTLFLFEPHALNGAMKLWHVHLCHLTHTSPEFDDLIVLHACPTLVPALWLRGCGYGGGCGG
jgi:hypothetical protein